jgi:hypothetical protein
VTALTAARSTIADLLAGAPWPVQYDVPDAVHPPTLFVVEQIEHLTPGSFCAWNGAYDIVAVAGRLVPGAGMDLLDEMVDYVLSTMAAAKLRTGTIAGAVRLEIAGVQYLAKRVPVNIPITVGS